MVNGRAVLREVVNGRAVLGGGQRKGGIERWSTEGRYWEVIEGL